MTSLQLRHFALGDLAHELSNTRKVLARIPFDRDDWSPHAKSFSVRKLAAHCANLPFWGTSMVKADVWDFAAPQPPAPPLPTTSDELLQRWDANVRELTAALDASTDAHLTQTWTLRRGETVMTQMPRVAAMRGFLVSHLIHHRGQLTVYLRLMDVPVPGLYGASADEK
jgi:uncharacterized damage-inducible protein DinB